MEIFARAWGQIPSEEAQSGETDSMGQQLTNTPCLGHTHVDYNNQKKIDMKQSLAVTFGDIIALYNYLKGLFSQVRATGWEEIALSCARGGSGWMLEKNSSQKEC